jgi:TIR domain
MADIFVSYARADRDRAKVIAAALEAQGWSVWWDRSIPPGRRFDEVIDEELTAAGCVVVLWSAASVGSDWVKTEAADARDRRILVPVLIEHVKIPLEFRRLQAADLSRWQPGQPDARFDEFSRTRGHVTGRYPGAGRTRGRGASSRRPPDWPRMTRWPGPSRGS